MNSLLSRRSFLERAALLTVAAPLGMRRRFVAPVGPNVRVGAATFAASATNARAMGLVLGAEEAAHAASLFGGSFTLVPLPSGDLHGAGLSAIIGDDDCAHVTTLSAKADVAGIPFMNVGCPSDALRGARCGRSAFHVAPSEAMRRGARAEAHVAAGEVIAWHPSLVRFGADTLNRRFRERFGTPMTADAWTAWLATKILWESALRMKSAEPAGLIQCLQRDDTQFDGHKGLPLSFRAWDHQLRQPLYVMQGRKVIEVPVAVRPGEPARDMLDRLGAPAAGSGCHILS
jgi:hypothetical protein